MVDLQAAYDAYLLGFDVAKRAGRPWAPYGFEARLMAALVAYELGDVGRSASR